MNEEIKELIDNEEKSNECKLVRDENGKIIKYIFTSYKKNKEPFACELSREQVEHLMSSYSIYGMNLPKAAISPDFEVLTAHDLGRIIKCLGVYKYDVPFARHQIEELSDEELNDLHVKILTNKQQKKLEKNQQRAKEKVYQDTYNELQEYKNLEKIVSNIHVDVSDRPVIVPNNPISGKSLMLHLADLHIGACCESYTLYNNPYNKEEVYRRFTELLYRISDFGYFDTIILNNLGDNLDGMDNQTARRDHYMPQNMDNNEQVDTYLEVMIWFINQLRSLANEVKVYSVPNGNHDGIAGKIANIALQQTIKRLYPDVQYTLFDKYRDYYTFKGHYFCIEHGKDETFHKKGLPLDLNDKTKVFLFEWLRYNGISGEKNIHFIKGDLHSNNLNSCEAFTYRNVLSMFGASDYSNMNFSRNSYGISYELFIGDNMISGTFENL